MTKRPFPAISALRGFEAAARHLNFSRAASEMNVTPSAISHQIRQIEELWQLELFDRGAGRLALSSLGQNLAPVVHDFLARLEHILAARDRVSEENVLRVNVHESLAVAWLLPRLSRFYSTHPAIRIWLSTDAFVGFDQMDVDVAICLAPCDWKGTLQEVLLKEYMFPVCSPNLIRRLGRPSWPDELLAFPLIGRHCSELEEQKTQPPSWLHWFAKYGLNDVRVPASMMLPNTSMAIQAAIDGTGVALARSAHITDQLERGQLVALFEPAPPTDSAYCFLTQRGRQPTLPMQAFRQWLKREAAIAQTVYDLQAERPGPTGGIPSKLAAIQPAAE